ncbi:MAG: phasin [Alphaproteobacteria bacterium]|nr:phasin [Alphaproteobacteria bacterium]
MRDFAEKSVDQARKAFDGFLGASVDQARKAFDGFLGAAHKAVSAADSQTVNAQANSRDLAEKAIGYAEKNIAAAFDLAERLVHAKDVQDVVHIQTEFVKSQFATLQSQMAEFGSAMQSTARKATESAQATVESAAAEMRKAATDAAQRKQS